MNTLIDIKMTYGDAFMIVLLYIVLTHIIYYFIYKCIRYRQRAKNYRTIYLYKWRLFDYTIVFGTVYLIIGFIGALIINKNILL